jgi:hypothetical protein
LKIAVRSEDSGTPLTNRRSLTGVNYVDLFGGYLKDQNLGEKEHRVIFERGSAVIRKVMAGEAGEEDATA